MLALYVWYHVKRPMTNGRMRRGFASRRSSVWVKEGIACSDAHPITAFARSTASSWPIPAADVSVGSKAWTSCTRMSEDAVERSAIAPAFTPSTPSSASVVLTQSQRNDSGSCA